MAWRCRFLAARRSQDGRVVAEKRLREELSGAPDAPVVSTQVDTAFAALDVSHTGKITASDVMACAAGLGVKVDASDVQKWIASHDVAGDGELSPSEFKAMMATMSSAEEFRHGEKYLTKL